MFQHISRVAPRGTHSAFQMKPQSSTPPHGATRRGRDCLLMHAGGFRDLSLKRVRTRYMTCMTDTLCQSVMCLRATQGYTDRGLLV